MNARNFSTLGLALFLFACGSNGDDPNGGTDSGTPPTDSGTPTDSGIDPIDLCGALNPTGACADGYRCYGGNCFEETEFCSTNNPSGLCGPNESCEQGSCIAQSSLCSASNPTGQCDSGQTCRAGQCVNDDLLCSTTNPTGLCPNSADSCVDGQCLAPNLLCSETNPTGACEMPLECIQGNCSTPNPCSANEPQGFCDTGNRCIDGTCIANSALCASANPTGVCVAGRTCIDGTCTDDTLLCSANQPSGVCETGSVCFQSTCTAESDLCSSSNQTGLCETAETCVDGSCVGDATLCSNTNPTGVCAGGDACFEGSCTDPATLCSASNQTGTCPAGESCNAGTCEPVGGCTNCGSNQTCLDGICRNDTLLCSPNNPTGLCESGFDCIAGSCIDAGVGCSSNNQSGVCPSGQICNAGVCEVIDDASLCDDDNPCTRDWFDYARNRCAHDPQTAVCSDGNACTNDVCTAGQCVGTPIGGCVEPPVIDPYVTPTNDSVLNLSGTKPSGSSIQINGLEAVPQNPDTTWNVVLNLVPGENVYVIRSVDQGTQSATIEVRVVYDITPPVTSLTPAGGVFLNGITVRVASNEAATVYYTTDGATPSEFSSNFQSVKEFRIFDRTTLRFLAKDQAGNWESNVVDADYEITSHGNGWTDGPTLSEDLIHTAVTTHGSSVYVVGGSDGLAPQAGAFAYDTVNEAWTTLPSMTGGRAQLELVTVVDRIYAIGGENNGSPLGTVEMLDLNQGTLAWTTLAPMPSTRFGLSAVVRGNLVHVFGGKTNGGAVLTNHEVFNAQAGTWTNQVAQMPRARYAFGSVIHDGLIYLVGGEDAQGTPIAEVDVYDPQADDWTTVASIPTPRSFAAVSLLNNVGAVDGGHTGIVVAGGRIAGGATTPTVEEYLIEDDTWRERTPLDAARQGGSSVTVQTTGVVDSREAEVWFLGGQLPSGLSSSIVKFSFSQDYVRQLSPMPDARFMHAAAALNSRVYLFGGRNFAEELGAWSFDPETETYQTLPPIQSYQNGLSAVALGDYVYAIGGSDNFGNSVATVRAYDPVLDQWVARAPLQTARRNAAVAVLGGEIYVVGGFNGGALQTVEVYNPETDMWRSAPVLPVARTGAMAVAHQGDLYVAGGFDGGNNGVASLIRLRNGAWSTAQASGFSVAHGAAFLVGDAQLDIFAGRRSGLPSNGITQYDLVAGTFPRNPNAQTLLLDPLDFSAATQLYGKIYLFGGNATQAIGPSGEATVQKIAGHCFNGVRDQRETLEDEGGGCTTRGIEHYTGLGKIFYNDFAVNTSSEQRAIDACNAHYNTTSCSRTCPTSSNCYVIMLNGSCSCNNTGYRWIYGTTSCYAQSSAGEVQSGGCSRNVNGNWY